LNRREGLCVGAAAIGRKNARIKASRCPIDFETVSPQDRRYVANSHGIKNFEKQPLAK